MDRKKSRKRKEKPRKQRPRFWIVLCIIVLTIGAGAYIATLPIWKIKEVVVNGTKMLSAEEVKTMAGIPLSENLFLTGFGRAKSNLSKITAIESFSFYRIPPATVLISVKERKPIATIIFPKKSAIIDQQGYIINRNPNITLNIPNRADLPIVSGIEEEKVLRSDRVDAEISQVISQIILKLSSHLESKRMQLELGRLENVSFLLDDLLRVKVGEAEGIRRKMEVFEALLSVISGKWDKVEYVDVRYPDNPVIKYKKGG